MRMWTGWAFGTALGFGLVFGLSIQGYVAGSLITFGLSGLGMVIGLIWQHE